MSIPSGATHVIAEEGKRIYLKYSDGCFIWDNDDWREAYSQEEYLCEKYGKPINSETVNSPTHYTKGEIECIDAIKSAVVGKSGIEAVCVANVIKYLWRYEEKGGIESVKKSEWYLKRLLEELK